VTPGAADLAGRAALVVGASRGLGREAALALAAAGADVGCAARGADALGRTAADIEALGRRSLVLITDAGDERALTGTIADFVDAFGRLDILVYAAGVMHAAPALQTSSADWDRVLRVNLTGAFIAAREAGRHMKSTGGRIIVFGTSFVGRVLPLTVAYSAAKAGLHQLVHSLALEWARYNVTVNAIAPGYFETEMPKAVLDDPELRARVIGRVPLRRIGHPSEIGPLVVYLALDASAFMTGSILRIDGGQALHVS
jgi:2-deoxy-D-gluconate 3-dehydrogenase